MPAMPALPDPFDHDALALAVLVRRGEISPAELLEDAIARAMPLPRAAVVEGSMRFSWKTCADMFESWLVPCGSITPGTSPGQFAAALPR